MWHRTGILCACIGVAVVASGCNDLPSSIGAEFLPDTTQLQVLSSELVPLIESVRTEQVAQPLFNTGWLFLGRYRELEARVLLRFVDIPDTLAGVTAEDILEATLILSPERYALGDTAGGATVVPFRIHPVVRFWSPLAIWDSLFANGDAATLDLTPIGSWNDPIPLQDSSEPVRVRLNAAGHALLAEWFRRQADSQSIYGVALVPEPTATSIRAFATQTIGQLQRPLPTLEVLYRRAGRVDTLRLSGGYASSFVRPPADTAGKLLLQSGVQYRVRLRVRLDALPPLAAIHQVQLWIPVDTAAFWTGNREFSRVLRLMPADSAAPGYIQATATYDAATASYATKSLAAMLEFWLRHRRSVGELLITLPADVLYSRLDRIALLPGMRMWILYSERKQP